MTEADPCAAARDDDSIDASGSSNALRAVVNGMAGRSPRLSIRLGIMPLVMSLGRPLPTIQFFWVDYLRPRGEHRLDRNGAGASCRPQRWRRDDVDVTDAAGNLKWQSDRASYSTQSG